ncbi:hypothetical protein [Streptomyces sp. wa22]|nr:hypothetical protein [Streptomyces sp. wa22]
MAAAGENADASRLPVMLEGAGISGLNPKALLLFILRPARHRRVEEIE